jgi:formamidopyrimidine-DNA glycosylase
MPELPEVESEIQTLCNARPSLIGRRIELVQVIWDGVVADGRCDVFRQQLSGAVFATAERLGKFMLFGLDCGTGDQILRRFLIIHLRMTGRLFLIPAAESLDRHTRLALLLDQGVALRFDDPRKFGRVWLVEDPAEVVRNLGPDALTIGFEQFAQRYALANRQLKPLLLDQSFIAGIGNIYADECLFRAGLHPLENSRSLSVDDQRRLHAAVRTVLAEAVAAKGANIDGVFKAGSFRASVYGRQGRPCPVCGTVIVKTRVGQRGTHYCPSCQVLGEKS